MLRTTSLLGIDLKKLSVTVRNVNRFVRDLRLYAQLSDGSQFQLQYADLYPVLSDYADTNGKVRGHYFHQDLWAAKKIYRKMPKEHVDVGSRIDGFVAHLLTFMPVKVIDIRPLDSPVSGLTFVQADAAEMEGVEDDSIDSMSSLHAIEHFGLGRYGDQVDPSACFQAMRAFARVLAPGGALYLSVPIGLERLEFNAHRVFSPSTILKAFEMLLLESFSVVDDEGIFRENVAPSNYANANYSCGLFEFTKSL